MSRAAVAVPGQLDLFSLLGEAAERPPFALGGPGSWPGPCGSTVTVPEPPPAPVLDVAHAGRHVLWAWALVRALRSPADRATFLSQRYGGGGDCDACGWWEYDRRTVTLAARCGWRTDLAEVRFTWDAILRDLDRRAAERPALVAEIIAVGTNYDRRWHPLADVFWGGAA